MCHKEHAQLSGNVLSCTGFIILVGGCPIIWASKKQTEIKLSTTESEHTTLSTATKDILPLHQILTNINAFSFITLPKQTMIF
jgi:hypothetical protein